MAQKRQFYIIFLSETLSKVRKLQNIIVMLKYDACLAVDVKGRSEGLKVLSKKNINYSLMNLWRNFVNLLIGDHKRVVGG